MRLCFAAVAALLLAAVPGGADDSGGVDDPGRMLFEGSAVGLAQVALGGTTIDAVRFPCRSCHGRDGRGGNEGDAPPIDWSRLTRPAADRPAYDRTRFATALREGIAASDRPLAATMPRYRIDDEVVVALADHLAALPSLQRRGITPDRVTLGVVVPPDNASVAEAYAKALAEALTHLPPAHGRRLAVTLFRGSPSAILDRAATEAAAVIGLPPSAELGHRDFLDRGIPVLAPLYPPDGDEDVGLFRSFSADWGTVIQALQDRLGDTPGRVAVVSDAQTAELHPGLDRRIDEAFGPDVRVAVEGLAPGVLASAGTVVLIGQDTARMRAVLEWLAPDTQIYALANLASIFETTDRRWQTPPVLILPQPALALASIRSGRTPLESHAKAAAALVGQAMLLAGRDLTRSRLLASVGRIDAGPLGTDFTTFSLTGSVEILFLPRLPGK